MFRISVKLVYFVLFISTLLTTLIILPAFADEDIIISPTIITPSSDNNTENYTEPSINIASNNFNFYEGICSGGEQKGDLLVEVDLAKWSRGSLVSNKSSTLPCVDSPNSCEWVLKIMPQKITEINGASDNDLLNSLLITFDHFDIAPIIDNCSSNNETLQNDDEDYYDNYPPCHFNYLNVSYFDEEEKEHLIGQYCGDGWIAPLVAKPSWHSIAIRAHLTRPYNGFNINFKQEVMMGQTSPSPVLEDTISDGECPSTYFQCPDESKRCIPLTFQCDANVDCKSGADESFCNSNELMRGKQIAKAAKSTDSGCGSDRYQRGINGMFSSENFPKNYENDARCIWYVTTAPGTKIFIKFNPSFAIEAGKLAMSEDCPYDSLTIYALNDAPLSEANETRLTFLGRHCGQKAPNAFMTPGHSILVIFETDSGNTGTGFRLFWQAITNERADYLLSGGTQNNRPSSSLPPALKTTTPNPLATFRQPACLNRNGTVLTSQYGSIRSPGFGVATYPHSFNCHWVIRPNLPHDQMVKSVEICFYDFNVQPSENCTRDSLEVTFYDTKKRRHRGRYCDSNRPIVGEGLLAETNGDVHVIFRSDFDVQARGFELGYRVATQPKGGSLNSELVRPKPKKRKTFSMSDHCGKTTFRAQAYSDQMDRVVGGQKSTPGSWPFVAELLFRGRHYCGATILNEYWLLTAAHCFRTGRRSTRGWRVAIGRYGGQNSNQAVIYPQIHKILVHRNRSRVANTKAYDIALIRLRDRLDFDQLSIAKPACLPSRDVKPGVDRCYVIGWGMTQGTGHDGHLNHALLPVIENDECRRMNFFYSTLVDDRMFCAGYQRGGVDACQGDSGGPLLCSVKGRWEVHGIVSFGKGCAGANAPGVYTRVYSYSYKWIRKVVNAFESQIHFFY